MNEPITVAVTIQAPREVVWKHWNDAESMKVWSHASDDWHTPRAENDLRVGGAFLMRMEARDGSAGFDFTGTYTRVEEHSHIAYSMDDGRRVEVSFTEGEGGILVTETFDPENENPRDMQHDGWLAILNNFKVFVESQKS